MSDLVGNPEDRFSQNEAQSDCCTSLGSSRISHVGKTEGGHIVVNWGGGSVKSVSNPPPN